VAPKGADYKFNLFSLVNISIYKSLQKGSAEITYTTPFLSHTVNEFFPGDSALLEKARQVADSSMSSTVALLAGDHIYFEIYTFSSSYL